MTHDSLDLVLHTGLIHVAKSQRNQRTETDTAVRGGRGMCPDGRFIPDWRVQLPSG